MTEDQKVRLLTLLSNVEDKLLDAFEPDPVESIFEALDILRKAIEEVANDT